MSARSEIRRVPERLVIGRYGQPVIERGYTEIAGIRFYDDQVVINRYGEICLDRGYATAIRSLGRRA